MTVSAQLLARLPRTFQPPLQEQLRQWDLLFPAEQRTLRATLGYLDRLPEPELRRLFHSLVALEDRMEVSRWKLSSDRLTISDVSLLVRSPYYRQWRAEVERIFEQVNAAIEAEQPRPRRLIVCVLPAGLPLAGRSPWPALERKGRWIQLAAPFAGAAGDFFAALAGRPSSPGVEPLEMFWVLEAAGQVATLAGAGLSFEELAPVRREFLRRLNAIRKDLRSADEVYEELRRLDLRPLLVPRLRRQPRLAEFLRSLFLSGNGALLFNNSFVQWGAAEALRRAQPQVLVCSFGIRHRPKPFSSVVLFEDQQRANPVPNVEDPAGSLVDIQVHCEYVRLAAEGLPGYVGRTLYLFASQELSRILALATPSLPLPQTASGPELARAVLDWLT